ncbi:hypothetical protein [Jeotgalibacillus haloalkalitolerans]|uniref:Uncharacterized protein n=1 Tax=Jeotgalibacillus haloalkalitolerans TaxID=3104292 RepID=A0ABU5KNF4_9BACL|nr:hypothetical protein [Jeotgalibacillus sp. HH7-29]MDZ5712793.1 hypothetical protein [Jeotgalibacillus sp. HH7-29]
MIEIKNPYSRKRFSLKEKAQKKFTRLVVPWIRKIPLNDDYNAKRRFVPQSINRLRIDIEYKGGSLWTNNIPSGVEVNLVSMYVAEYIPIENIDKLNKGLKKIFKNFAPKRFNTNDISRIDDFCRKVKESIHGTRWSRFGFLEIDKEHELSKFVKRISVNGSQISSSSIIIEFIIEPSDNFHKEYKELIEKNVEEETVLTPKFKYFFSSWGSTTPSNIIAKEQMVEDFLLELKWRTLKEISKYFDMYFTINKLIPPSIEVYKINQNSCELKSTKNEFWESIGMRNNYLHEISKDGYWQLFVNDRDTIDSSIKFACNNEVPKDDMFHSLDFQLEYRIKELALHLFPIMVMRDFTLSLSKKIAKQQEKTFKSIKKENPNYNKLINIRYELEQNLQILKRFKNEMGNDEFEWIKGKITSNLNEFEPAIKRANHKPFGKVIVDNTIFLVGKTDTLSLNFAKIIDDTVKLLELKTNNSLRTRTFWLTVSTSLLSVLAIVIATLQLTDDKISRIKEFLESIANFFI